MVLLRRLSSPATLDDLEERRYSLEKTNSAKGRMASTIRTPIHLATIMVVSNRVITG
jgi:hypothetical protein